MSSMSPDAVLFLGKRDDSHCGRAAEFIRRHFTEVRIHLGAWGEPFPAELRDWRGEYIFSYLSRWVVPAGLIAGTSRAALNFHPAPPEYPGIGCVNFALYHEAKTFGAMCHHLAEEVDTGPVVAVRRFPVFPEDDVAALLARTYDFQLVLFYEVVAMLLKGEPLPTSGEHWSRRPYTRKQLNELGRLTLDMTPEEVARRVRAASYGAFQPSVEFSGHTFRLAPGRD